MVRMLKIAAFTVPALVLGASVALSASNPIAERQAAMKNNGAAMKAVVPMVKGEIEYNAAAAELAMRVLNNSAHGFSALFPDGTQTGGDTEAAPAIWEKMGDFEAAAAKFAADTAAAAEAAKGGLDSFKAAFGQAAGNCKGCHDDFRIKK
jgi:cytochrome c556